MALKGHYREAPGAERAPTPEALFEDLDLSPASVWHQQDLRRRRMKRPLRIEAIAVAAGGDSAEELPQFVEVTRFFHPEIPLYVLTDREGRERLIEAGLAGEIEVLDEIGEAELDALSGEAKDHGGRWSKPWIGAKIEVLSRAVRHFNLGVLLCDADLLLTRRLDPIRWEADLVLSTHQGPLCDVTAPLSHGYFNAGMVLTRDLEIVERWREMYREGRGSFYEQQCLEDLSREFVTDHFPASWNWGYWRMEPLDESARRPEILHGHFRGRWADQERGRIYGALRDLANAVLENVRIAKEIPPLIGEIHFPKAAGSMFNLLLERFVCRERNYQMVNGFGPENAGLERDFTPEEMALIAKGSLWGLRGNRRIVHNHAQNWNAGLLDQFRGAGYRFIALYRPIKERLPSFYYWNRANIAKGGQSVISGDAGAAETLDEFLRLFVSGEVHHPEWILPDWHREIDFWFPATSAGMERALREIFRIEGSAWVENASENPGWDQAIASGEISKKTIREIDKHPGVRAWRDFGKSSGLDQQFYESSL